MLYLFYFLFIYFLVYQFLILIFFNLLFIFIMYVFSLILSFATALLTMLIICSVLLSSYVNYSE